MSKEHGRYEIVDSLSMFPAKGFCTIIVHLRDQMEELFPEITVRGVCLVNISH